MPKKLTKEEFIRRAREVHGDRYDYSKVVYTNSYTPVVIICRECGLEFKQRPTNHLYNQGCPKCAEIKRAQSAVGVKRKPRMMFGIGLCDILTVDENGKTLKSYTTWYNILKRCYSESYHKAQPTYIGCKICDEWKVFSVFKKWYDENVKDGYEVDKDLVAKNAKYYSQETCSFVPCLINHIISRCSQNDKARGKYPLGVTKDNACFSKYVAQITEYGKWKLIGRYDTPTEAALAYKEEKERYIKEVADEYYSKGLITKRVYDALYRWEIEITD